MPNEPKVIEIDGTSIEIKNLVDLHTHWPKIRDRLELAIENDEFSDPNLRKIVEWLIVLAEKTLFRMS